MKKAVFFDIDGTLWNYQMQIPKAPFGAIRKLRENGHYAFIWKPFEYTKSKIIGDRI